MARPSAHLGLVSHTWGMWLTSRWLRHIVRSSPRSRHALPSRARLPALKSRSPTSKLVICVPNLSARFPDLGALFPDIRLVLPMSGQKLPASRSRPQTMKLLAACFVSNIARNLPTALGELPWTPQSHVYRRRFDRSPVQPREGDMVCGSAHSPRRPLQHYRGFDSYSHKSHARTYLGLLSHAWET